MRGDRRGSMVVCANGWQGELAGAGSLGGADCWGAQSSAGLIARGVRGAVIAVALRRRLSIVRGRVTRRRGAHMGRRGSLRSA